MISPSPAHFRTFRYPHDDIKFVKGLSGRDVQIIRKWGTWQDWFHDSALVSGPGPYYILVALTHNPKGDDYLVALAKAVDDLMTDAGTKASASPARPMPQDHR